MPLSVHEGDLPTTGRRILIFYASIDSTGKMWCPDCRDVDDHVKKIFDESSEEGLIIYAGQKPEWKSPNNRYRSSHTIQSIPTIVRLNNGQEEARLVEGEILEPGKLEALIHPDAPVQGL